MTHVAMTIAGSDSGGGAGIQADLKTFAAFKVYGTSAITCVTAQNPNRVTGIQPVTIDIIEQQILAVLDFFSPIALKTGMLFSSEIIKTIASALRDYKGSIIIDPVMVATSGAKLLKEDAIEVLKKELIPRATLVTPNLDEMSILLDGYKIFDIETMKKAVYLFYEIYAIPVILKGGHLSHSEEAIDILFTGDTITEFTTTYLTGVNTHGTGCTYSAAITAGLALGNTLQKSIQNAKDYIQKTIASSLQIGDQEFLNHFV